MWLIQRKKCTSPYQVIISGFLLVILTGGLLLTLPISSQSGNFTPFLDALFTSTSAVCVTGLVIHDTATYWSEFGQVVILTLIQIGGLGVVTVAGAFSILSGRKIGLMERSTMQEAISAPKVGGVVRLTRFILKTSIAIELIGAACLYPVFSQEFGWFKGIWYSVFHSISAFCNAGFDLMGVKTPFSSLVDYSANPLVSFTIMGLIVVGGIGFLTWDDIRTNGLRVRKYRMQSKVILSVTGILILVPALCFFFFEFSGFPLGERILLSLFQSVTPRTAGFNTADLTAMSETGQFLMTLLMVIGGSPGSTAGGIKTTTLAVLMAAAVAVFHRREDAHFFSRRLPLDAMRNASTILMMYLTLFLGGGMAISVLEGLPILPCIFETASAIGTVGLTLGITPELSLPSHLILICLMFFGRVGGLTLVYATLSTPRCCSKLPQEPITVG